MAEIKGQLLGIVLAIGVFGVVFAAMTATFQKVSKAVEDKATSVIAEDPSLTSQEPAPRPYLLHY